MKKLRLVFLLSAPLFIAGIANAKIWRVNNTPGVSADFTTAVLAHNGAADGDTIHLEPSISNYGNVTCTKKLVWLSVGAFLSENPGNQFSSITGQISTMTFNSGSDGSVVSVYSNGQATINAPNVTIFRSYFASNINVNSAGFNAVITQSFCGATISLFSINTIVTNNMVYRGVSMGATASAIITNNVLNYGANNFGGYNIYNAVFQNNISVKGGTINFTNSQQSHNMSPDASFPAGDNNQQNVTMTTVFVNPTGTADKDFLLKTGSPAIGAGFSMVDLGAFGGSSPFVLGMQPNIPAITTLSAPAANSSSTIQVTFSAKSNN